MTIKVYCWDTNEQEVFGTDIDLPMVTTQLTQRQLALLVEDGVMQACPGYEEGNHSKKVRVVSSPWLPLEEQLIVLDGEFGRGYEIHFYACLTRPDSARDLAKAEFAAWDLKTNG